jgi:hypothetical protein
MLNIFSNNQEPSKDVKTIRHELVRFIKEQLKRNESGEGSAISSLQLFLAPSVEERHLYESAIYFNDKTRFRNEEVQKIADDYAIDLPKDWVMEMEFADILPDKAIKAPGMPVSLYIATRQQLTDTRPSRATLSVLNGEAELQQYTITASSGKVCIGRDKRTQTDDGFMRENTIAFPSTVGNESNRFISRQHAHIEWSETEGCFYLYADEGGIPPKNKIKVQTTNGEQLRLQTMEIGHRLKNGDQILLGESALLGFNYITEGANNE